MPFGSTPKDATGVPIAEVYVPGTANSDLTALEGITINTDGQGQKSAAARFGMKDGDNVTFGAQADAAITDASQATKTHMAFLKGLVKIFADVWDSVNHRIKVDGSGVTQPVSGSVSVSNFPGTQPVSGTVTANAGSGTFNNQQSNIQSDYDTGAGTQNTTMMGVALPANGGAVPGGTSSNPIRTDPTGATTQPVSGTVTANAGTNLNTSALALEAGGHLAAIDTAQGAQADAAVTNPASSASLVAALKGLLTRLAFTLAADSTDKLKVSLYGGNVGAGDTFVGATAGNSLKVNVTNAPLGSNITQVNGIGIGNNVPIQLNAVPAQLGTSDFHLISAASTNATSIKASTGQVYGWTIYNTNAAARYVKLYNKASAPNVGTDTPLRTIGIPPAGYAQYHTAVGIKFGTGIALAATTGIADADSAAVGASDLAIEIDWI